MSKQTIIYSSVGVSLIAIVAGSWALTSDGEPEVVVPPDMTVEALKEQVKDPDKMMATMEKMWEQRDQMSDEQRRQMRRNMGQVMRDTFRGNMDEYFDAETEEDKNAILDRHIDDMQEWMKRFEEMRKRREEEGKDDESEREKWRQARKNRSPEERKERSESRSPDQMVRMMTYFGAMQARAKERGIEMPRFGPGGGRGRRGGG